MDTRLIDFAASSGARLEDQRFLTGSGRFSENLTRPGCLHARFLRAPLAHAEIDRIDCFKARALPGVVAVFTADDLARSGVGPLPALAQVATVGGQMNVDPPRPALASGRVRHQGEAIAVVIAETDALAADAVAAIEVAYRPLPVVVDAEAAISAPVRLWPMAPDNLCFDWEKGDRVAVDAAFAQAAHLVKLSSACNRVSPSPLETRAAMAEYDAASDCTTLWTPSQGVHLIHDLLCNRVLGLRRDQLRVVTDDVGGGFGLKFYLYPEQAVIAWAARQLRRPVRWISGRIEAFLSDIHARDQSAACTLALDADGRFLALRVESIANLGAYLSTFAAMIPSEGAAKIASGPYRIPAIHMRVKGVFTNTVPVDAYRGAGKPEMAFLLERLVDLAAVETGRDRIALRRLNMIPASAMPYTTPLGIAYDSGDFSRLLDVALAESDARGFEARRRHASERGRLRGFGISCYLHITGGFAREKSMVRVASEGHVLALTGTQSNGHGHETSFAHIVARVLELPIGSMRIRQGDTAALPTGGGTGGSSSTIISANALQLAAVAVVERARRLASLSLEASAEDIVYRAGTFTIVGTDRCVGLFDLARRAESDASLPDDLKGPLQGEGDFKHTVASCPSGVIICEAEIDPETGAVTVDKLVSAQDIGPVVTPALVDGQVHGGIAQSLGQALIEHLRYDPESGRLLTSSYDTYALPRAEDLPFIASHTLQTPSPNNALGIKGVGEIPTIGTPPAIMNAVVDALTPLGVRHLDMPATPENVWRAIRAARG